MHLQRKSIYSQYLLYNYAPCDICYITVLQNVWLKGIHFNMITISNFLGISKPFLDLTWFPLT